MSDNWMALESNPEVINEYIEKLGFKTTEFNFVDMYSFEPWAQDMINKPILGILFNFPWNSDYL